MSEQGPSNENWWTKVMRLVMWIVIALSACDFNQRLAAIEKRLPPQVEESK